MHDDIIKNEQNASHYNDLWESGYGIRYRFEQPYVISMVELLAKYCRCPKHVLDVGAGFGFPALRFISTFMLRKYTAYEFSNSIDFMSELLSPFKDYCDITLHKKTFKNIQTSNYDCVIALEILEHIIWDKEFIGSLKSGTRIFLSVPKDNPGERHVRIFQSHRELVSRYEHLVTFEKLILIGKWYCAYCKKI